MSGETTRKPGPEDLRRARVEGRGIALRGDDIDTDRIIPARFLRCVTFEGLGEHVFEDDRKSFPGGLHPFDRPELQRAEILVVSRNFGCGSSREHAPQSLWRWGIRALVGVSFAEIFFGNCAALGVPCVTLAEEEVARLQDAVEKDPALRVIVDVEHRSVMYGERSAPAGLPDGVRQAFLTGTWDSAALLMDRPEEIDAVAARLPYVSLWTSGAAPADEGE
ncbi:MAG: 3-isopropylmalate dehydratase small subunit [Planctomycetes bacterium]|nr:3-isopropylmalate dehydratase small subunit [Planctomycetota bacterium]